MKQIKHLVIFAVFGVLLLCGCSMEKSSLENDRAITVVPAVEKDDVPTRAFLYNGESDLRSDILRVHVYDSGTSDLYFDSNLKYSTEDIDESRHRWLFHDGSSYVDHYWPPGIFLDFFAYAPLSCGYVTPDTSVNPPEFTAVMPLDNSSSAVNLENMKEFAYAYSYKRDRTGGSVPLVFHHPFAAVMFKVAKSQRDLTVKSISIDGISRAGTCRFDPLTPESLEWDTDGLAAGNLMLEVGKIIPGDVNFGGDLCGPYPVLPQKNSGADAKNLCIECHWAGYDKDSDDESDDTKVLEGKISNDWEPGQIYTYTLDLGNSREEILFEVSVTPWKYVYEHEFEIE